MHVTPLQVASRTVVEVLERAQHLDGTVRPWPPSRYVSALRPIPSTGTVFIAEHPMSDPSVLRLIRGLLEQVRARCEHGWFTICTKVRLV